MSGRYTNNSTCIQYEKSPACYAAVNSEPLQAVLTSATESHREESQANIIFLKFIYHFNKTSASTPARSGMHKVYFGRSFSTSGEYQEVQNDINVTSHYIFTPIPNLKTTAIWVQVSRWATDCSLLHQHPFLIPIWNADVQWKNIRNVVVFRKRLLYDKSTAVMYQRVGGFLFL